MHVFASGVFGVILSIGCAIYASDWVLGVIYSPLIVSGTIVALGMLPARRR